MGTSRSVDQFAAKMAQCGRVAVENRDTVAAVADTYKHAFINTARQDTGDGKMSKWGRNGTKLSAGYEVKGRVNATAEVNPRPLGPWRVLEDGAKPHPIIPGLTRRQQRAMALFSLMAGGRGEFDTSALSSMARGNRNNRGGRRRRQRSMFLAVPGIGHNKPKQGAAWVNHPGTKPKNTYTRAKRRGEKAGPPAAMRSQVMGMAKVLR